MDLIKLSDVTEKPTRYLWKPYIPLGKITLLDGLPGSGKTTLASLLASAVTRGDGLVGLEIDRPSKVWFMSPEDTPEDTLKPKIRLHGGDDALVSFSADILEFEKDGDFAELSKAIKDENPRLIVIDLFAFVKNTSSARSALLKLSALADQHDCAILGIRHITKRGHDLAVYQGMGNVAFSGVARSILYLTEDPSDTAVRHMFHVKANCSEPGSALSFEFLEGGKLSLMGPCRLSLQELRSKQQPTGSALEKAQMFLADLLSSEPASATTVYEAATKNGIARRTIERAKKELGVTASKRGGSWFWCLKNPTKIAKLHLATLTNAWM